MFDESLKGKRIELVYTDDEYTNLKPGDQGTIEFVIPSKSEVIETQISVNWDNGSGLMLLQGRDKYKILN